ncbi:hypothetical protein [Nannocystis punicea]|uniref:Uncharacterized protein n=1 Tax=Nannocystis punicea TaxID=2995304 RepID=A0ABY7GYW0_9BACT|nr:hypothetical protein [Nannocystis poenicansa]WAS92188.1 hypothetical protein O0S08_38900 [Nannocystis poenicansa]
MRTAILTLPVLSTILACGPGAPGDTDTDPTTSSSSDASTAPGTTSTASTTTTEPATTDALPTTVATTLTEALPTTGVETTTGETTAETTTEPVETTTSTTSTDPSTTTTTDSAGPPDVAFAAEFWAGGLDHLTVRMAALKDDFCVDIRFARPGDVPAPELTLPPEWWYQGATVSQGAADCLDFMAPMPQAVAADSVAGVAVWVTEPFCPPTIDSLDLVLGFPQDLPWVPAEVSVVADSLAVSGC